MNHEAILAVLPESRDDAKSLKETGLAMEREMATYTDWIRVERVFQLIVGPGQIGAYAARIGLHDPVSESLADRFTPQCCRCWLATHLLWAGMSRDRVKWIRGYAVKELIDIYYHIDAEDVRKSYMAYVPQLGI